MPSFSLIVAYDNKTRGIGVNGDIPWVNQPDTKHFSRTTRGQGNNCVVMGRVTYESIGEPLPGRLNVVLSKYNIDLPEGVLLFHDIDMCIKELSKRLYLEEVFVIGGSQIYEDFLSTPVIKSVYTTDIVNTENYTYDKFFPELTGFELDKTFGYEIPQTCLFRKYTKTNNEEVQYLNLCSQILENGNSKNDRTGTGTLSMFGTSMRFSLKNGKVPLLTTKRVFLRGIIEELLFFISGKTDSKILENKGVNIWKGNTSREFLDSSGFHDREVGSIGPGYPHQWRHAGAEYNGCDEDYTGKGVDQLANCIDLIKNNPSSRRIILNSWNVNQLDEMSLVPCHILAQFYCNDGKLSISMYQRSCDVGLGLAFNIASYSILLHMICHITNMEPDEFVYFIGDAHIYKNHIEPIKEQTQRIPRGFPTIEITRKVEGIDDFNYEDFKLKDYFPYPSINMAMSA